MSHISTTPTDQIFDLNSQIVFDQLQSSAVPPSRRDFRIEVKNHEVGGLGGEFKRPSGPTSLAFRFLRHDRAPLSDDIIHEIENFKICQEINSMQDVEKYQEKVSMIKAHLPFGRLAFLSLLAGWWVGLAVILVVTIAGGVPAAVRSQWPMLPKLIAGFFFPVAIFFIVLFGGELFTGNSMSMLIGFLARRVTSLEILYNWSVVLVGNFAGATLTVYLFGYLTELFEAEPWLSYIQGVAVSKINLKPEVVFLKAIPANALVCACVLIGQSARDMTGKMLAMFFPIMTFAVIGFEHAIANMGFIPLGLMYGAKADYRHWLYQNLLLAILGNIVGGGIIVGGASYFLFDWTRLLADAKAHHHDLHKPDDAKSDVGAAKSPASAAEGAPPPADGPGQFV